LASNATAGQKADALLQPMFGDPGENAINWVLIETH